MKYIKVFSQDTVYQTFMGGGIIKPNVSYCRKENEVHYNPLMVQPNNEIWYTSTDGNIVEPYSGATTPFLDTSGNNIQIISNTYKNGKGIIKLEKNCYQIGRTAFYSCRKYATITLPKILTSIGDYAFNTCTSLTEITIPNSVTSIGNYAFATCPDLSSMTVLPETPPTLGSDALSPSAVIYVPSGSVDTYKKATNWSTYAYNIQAISE